MDIFGDCDNEESKIIGNSPYKYIPKKRYREVDRNEDIIDEIIKNLEEQNIKFSGVVGKRTVTFTVSLSNIAALDKIIEQQRNRRHLPDVEDVNTSDENVSSEVKVEPPTSSTPSNEMQKSKDQTKDQIKDKASSIAQESSTFYFGKERIKRTAEAVRRAEIYRSKE